MRITISGTPGSGKSTAARTLAERLGYPRINAGDVFRAAAKERGMTLNAFGAWLAHHPEWDRELDARLLNEGRGREHVILEGRLTGLMTQRERIPAFRVWMTADEATRISRVMERDGGTREDVRRRLSERTASEHERYRREYGLDLEDTTPYDLVVQTDTRSPEEVAALILEALDTWTRAPQRTDL